MNYEVIDNKMFFNGELVICQDCKSFCSRKNNVSKYYYCNCNNTRCGSEWFVELYFSFFTKKGEFLYNHIENESVLIISNNRIVIDNYCVVNKTTDQILKQTLLL